MPSLRAERLVVWQVVTGVALLVGYAGYYICRSNLSVAMPAMLADPSTGLDRYGVGLITSAGVVAYAAGKLVTGVAGDFMSGRALFLGGLFLSVGATLAFSAGTGWPWLIAWWMANRFVQSAVWAGLTKTASHWYPASRYGTVMSLLALSYLFGDALGRYVLGVRVAQGGSWQGVFVFAAATLALIGAAVACVLRGSPRDVGLREPAVSPANVFGEAGTDSVPTGVSDLLQPYLISRPFWMVCGMSCGMTLIREAFNTWIPVYLVDAHRLAPEAAARYSALFPLVGGASAVLVGTVTDRCGPGNRVSVIVPAMLLCVVALVALAWGTARHDLHVSMAAIAVTAFALLGPYTLLSGALALDMGGRKGSATAAGLIDTAGYTGGVLSGVAVGHLAELRGWPAVFSALALLAACVLVMAANYCVEHRRRLWRPEPEFL